MFRDSIIEYNEPRYAVVDFSYEDKEGNNRHRLLFISWLLEIANPKEIMIYKTMEKGVKANFEGLQKSFRCVDESDLDFDYIKDTILYF